MKTYSLTINKVTKIEDLFVPMHLKITSVVINLISNFFRKQKKESVVLPVSVNDMRLVRKMNNKHFPYATGLYKTNKNKLVVIKIWNGKKKDIHYYNLVKEILTLNILSGKSDKQKDLIISVPKLYQVYANNQYLLLCVEFIDGEEKFNKLTPHIQLTVYEQILMSFKRMYQQLSDHEKSLIGIKSKYTLMIQFPLLFLLSILKRPHLCLSLIKSFFAFYSVILFVKDIEKTIAHGDLHNKNLIFKNNKKIYIIDFEQTVITSHFVDVAASLSSKHLTNKFKMELLNLIISSNLIKNLEFSLFALFSTIYNLVSYKSNEQLKEYENVMNNGTKYGIKSLLTHLGLQKGVSFS